LQRPDGGEVGLRNEVRACAEDLGELHERRPERCDHLGEPPGAAVMMAWGAFRGPPHEDESVPVSQEGAEKWKESKKDPAPARDPAHISGLRLRLADPATRAPAITSRTSASCFLNIALSAVPSSSSCAPWS